MKVLLVGSGGREDALAWAIRRSPEFRTLRCCPGNAGIARHADLVEIPVADVTGIYEHAVAERYDLVVVGPEAPLVAGLGDLLRERGVAVFGPSSRAAQIEGSKVFAKEFLSRHRIPTASFRVFSGMAEATRHLESSEARYPLVVKADGLAAGKGVIVAQDSGQAVEAARLMLRGDAFGKAGSRIVVEEMLRGREVSFFVLSDGEDFVELASCQDYKRAGDGDTGPNTGGMGCYSPSLYLDAVGGQSVIDRIVAPTLRGLASEGRPYQGALYVGLMLTDDGPKVLEFNARFGDPEAQVLIPRLEGSWLAMLHASATGGLAGVRPAWTDRSAVCVVMVSGGYPGSYDRGFEIEGIAEAERSGDVLVFHAGTEASGSSVKTSGGRVLGVTALGADVREARRAAYEAVSKIHFTGEFHRGDIALDAARHLDGSGNSR